MSSGGMDWAYRMIAAHNLDPLGVAVVLHLGWRDAANQRTDSGIARALSQHRSSIRLATAKLEAAGLICRRSGQWVAVETVEIVTNSPNARRPDAFASDLDRPVSGHGQSVATPRPVSGHPNGQSVATMRKEKSDKGRRASNPMPAPRRLPPVGGGAALDLAKLSKWQLTQLREGKALVVEGRSLRADAPEVVALRSALRCLEGSARPQAMLGKQGGCHVSLI